MWLAFIAEEVMKTFRMMICLLGRSKHQLRARGNVMHRAEGGIA
jgi:hypothetical protein